MLAAPSHQLDTRCKLGPRPPRERGYYPLESLRSLRRPPSRASTARTPKFSRVSRQVPPAVVAAQALDPPPPPLHAGDH
jgi:hypothetical protein